MPALALLASLNVNEVEAVVPAEAAAGANCKAAKFIVIVEALPVIV